MDKNELNEMLWRVISVEDIKSLIAQGANVNAQDKHGRLCFICKGQKAEK